MRCTHCGTDRTADAEHEACPARTPMILGHSWLHDQYAAVRCETCFTEVTIDHDAHLVPDAEQRDHPFCVNCCPTCRVELEETE